MAVSAGQIIKRIRDHVGSSWLSPTSEGFECGGEDTSVSGIVTAWTPSLEVLEKAASLKHNLVIASEPPFWSEFGTIKTEVTYGRPTLEALQPNPVYQAKRKLIEGNGIAVFRFNENYRALPENPRLNALAEVLKFKGREDAEATRALTKSRAGVYVIPEVSLMNLAQQAKASAGAGALRTLGDPNASIRRVALLPGYMTDELMMEIVHDRNVDAVITGDACQWEAFEYAEDWIDAGWGKAMILLGQAATESPGGKALASWLQSFIGDVPVVGMATGEVYQFVPAHKA